MSIGISYMGTKRQLAEHVAGLVADCKRGPFLDLFFGMGAVGSAVAPARQVWANDLQVFASEVATARFCSQDSLLRSHDAADICAKPFADNRAACRRRFSVRVRAEQSTLDERDDARLAVAFEQALSSNRSRSGGRQRKHHSLFASYFGDTYFGIAQAIDADSIRVALDTRLADGKLTLEQHRWLLLALCVALSRCSTATGHFAQPLAPKPSNASKFIAQRRRSLWREWLAAVDELTPVGGARWRTGNQTFRGDAVTLLKRLHNCGRPAVVYADPPYTKDQYSRYYHLYETVMLYDYPGSYGRGQYRQARETSKFSLASEVASEISSLIEQCASLRCDLIISYPKNGLLPESWKTIPALIKKHYDRAAEMTAVPHIHSSFGSAHGKPKNAVTETLYRVRCNG